MKHTELAWAPAMSCCTEAEVLKLLLGYWRSFLHVRHCHMASAHVEGKTHL